MNETLIKHLESLPAEHLEVHVAAYPWFAAARVVLAKKKLSTDILQQVIAHVNDRKWLKDYWEKKSTAIEENPTIMVSPQEVAPSLVKSEENNLSKVAGSERNNIDSETEDREPVVPDALLDTAHPSSKSNEFRPPSEVELAPANTTVAQEKTFTEWLRTFCHSAREEPLISTQQPTAETLSVKDELETLMYSHIPYEFIENKLEVETHYAKGLTEFIAEQKQCKKQRMLPPHFDHKTQLPVTETFARLLEKQDKIKQAISIYEQLSLKFPQKSVYFASLIQKLKEKM